MKEVMSIERRMVVSFDESFEPVPIDITKVVIRVCPYLCGGRHMVHFIAHRIAVAPFAVNQLHSNSAPFLKEASFPAPPSMRTTLMACG